MTYKNSVPSVLAVLASALFAMNATATAPQIDGEVVVKLRSGQSIDSVLARSGYSLVSQFGNRPIYRLAVPTSESVSSAVYTLRAMNGVEFAEPNYQSEAPESSRRYVWVVGGSSTAYATQWAASAMNLPAAQSSAISQNPSNRSRVRVAVVDTGIDATHPAFMGRLIAGRDLVDNDADPSEEGSALDVGYGHGTHVAGLVALAAPNAQIMPIRALDASGRGNVWVLAEAIMHAVDPDGNPNTDDGAHVINLSVGTTQITHMLNAAIELATCSDDDDDQQISIDYSDSGFDNDRARCNLRYGAVVVSAAGNSGSATERQYPAAETAEGAISVTATKQNGTLASFANRGDWVDVAAPGDLIRSALPGGQWGTWSGTSMSTPLVSGVAALLKHVKPDWKPIDVTKRIFERSATMCGSTIRRVDALAIVQDYVVSVSCP